MKFEVVPGLDFALDLVASSAAESTCFLTRAWFKSAIEAYGLPGAQTLIARRSDGAPVIALPLVRAGPKGLLRQVPGSYWPFRGFPVAAALGADKLAAFLRDGGIRRSLGPMWRLGPVYENDPTIQLLLQSATKAGWSAISRRIATNYSMDLGQLHGAGDWPRSSTRKRIRYLEKQLGAQGTLEWRCVRGAAWSDEVLAQLRAVEERSWVGARTDRRTSKFLAVDHRRFWQGVVRDQFLGQRVQAALLIVAGTPIAFSLDIDAGPTKYIIANGYDAAWAQFSPGKLLAYRNLAEAHASGIRKVDWGAGDSGYKESVGATATTEIIDLLLCRGRLAGQGIARLAGRAWRHSGNCAATLPDQR